ncbi:MAG: transposase [Alphaproteobacteria bacterium]|nr:transposase [Alphaproteobacteria bacterium]
MICVDGGKDLLAALPVVYHGILVQRCWAHKIRNILNKVQEAVKADVHAVMNADTGPKALRRRPLLRRPLGDHLPQDDRCMRARPVVAVIA